LKFRKAKPVDRDAVVALWGACGLTRDWNDPVKDFDFALAGATSAVLVHEIVGQIVASVMVGHDGHRGAIYYLAVAPEHQKMGLGRAAVFAAENYLKKLGVWKINLMIRDENESAIGFYKAIGFEKNEVMSMGKKIG
jgi:ribosomal protein S18 acetylase RimI-like enzyme